MCVWAECRIPSIRANGGATAWLVGGLWAACGRLVGGAGGAERAASGGMGVWRELVWSAVLAVQAALKSGPGGLGGAKICAARSARG